MAKMTKSELEQFLKENQKDSTYKDYLRSDINSLFSVDEDDGFLERLGKGTGSLFAGGALSTGATMEGLATGKLDFSELDFDDFMNLVYSVPALKGLAASPKIAKEAFKVAQKGGFKKGIESAMKKLGPGNKAAKRTSGSQLASLSGLGSKSPKGVLKSLPGRAAALAGAGYVGSDILDRSSATPDSDQGSSLDSDLASENSELTLDNPSQVEDAQPGIPAMGSAASAINAANEMEGSGRYDPLGDFSKDILKNKIVGEAIRRTENEIAAKKKADREAADEARRADIRANSPEYAQMASIYASTGGRESGDFEALSQKEKDDAFRQFNLNRSAANNKRARIQSILDEEDRKHIAAGKPGPLPSDGFMFSNEDNNFFNDGSVSKDVFSEKTGLKRAGTSVMQHADGTFSPREFDGAFERAGGYDSAEAFLEGKDPSGEKLAALQHQLGGDRAYRYDGSSDAKGLDMGLDVGKDDVIFGADKAGYPGSNFDTYEDAVAYLNRPTLDNPDVPTSEPIPAPSEPEDDGSLLDYLPYALPLLTRGKVKPKVKSYKGPTSLTKPSPEYVNATPMPGPTYISKTPALPNRPTGLPNRPAGLPNSSNPSAPKVLGNRMATQEQFRRAQTGMGPSERAAAVGAKEAQKRAVADRMAEMSRKAQLEREARARRLAGQPLNPNPYGLPASQYHMNGQLAAKRPPFPL